MKTNKTQKIWNNSSLNLHRLEQNPAERIFLEEWEKENTDYRGEKSYNGVLNYLMGTNNTPEHVSHDQRVLAATVIQWLGSPVGLKFLDRVQKRIKEL